MKITAVLVPGFATLLTLAGCQADGDEAPRPIDRTIADAKPERRFVVKAMNVPDLSVENDSLAFNLDDDDRGTLDNKLGSVIQLAASTFAFDAQARVDEELASGRMLVVGSLRWNGERDEDDVALELLHGLDGDTDPGNNFAGGSVIADPAGPQGFRVYGRVRGGQFVTAEPGELAIKLSLLPGTAPVPLILMGVHVEATLDRQRGLLSAKIGGAIRQPDFDADFVPLIYDLIMARMSADLPPSTTAGLKQLFDTDKDGAITELEFNQSNTTRTVLSPDVDILDETTRPGPVYDNDGSKDSLSIGFTIEAVPVSF